MIRRILDTIAVIAFVAFLPLMAVAQSGVSPISASPGAKPGQGTKTSCSVAGGVWRTSSPAGTLDCGAGLTYTSSLFSATVGTTIAQLGTETFAVGTGTPTNSAFYRLAVNMTDSIGFGYSGANLITSGTDSTLVTYAPLFIQASELTLGYQGQTTVDRVTAGNLFRVRNNGTTVLEVPDGGGVQLSNGTKPTCNAAARGTLFYVAGGAGVADTYEVCVKDAGDAYAWTSIF